MLAKLVRSYVLRNYYVLLRRGIMIHRLEYSCICCGLHHSQDQTQGLRSTYYVVHRLGWIEYVGLGVISDIRSVRSYVGELEQVERCKYPDEQKRKKK